MRLKDNDLILAPTDLSNFLSCRHASALDATAARKGTDRPTRYGPYIDLLREKGIEHEKAYLAHLQAKGLEVLAKPDPQQPGDYLLIGREETIAAMAEGRDVIYQPRLADEGWSGQADFLLRVERPSEHWDWSYEVADTKLARDTRAGTILQLCVYTRLVEELQGARPERMHVVTPANDFAPLSYRTDDYSAYFRIVENGLERFVTTLPETYPEKVAFCDLCAWWELCEQRRRADDHLCYVAGISKGQIGELRDTGINRLEALATLDTVPKPRRGSHESLTKVRDQARTQLIARETGETYFEIREPIDEEHGFRLLPEPTPQDIFLDFEGNHFTDEGVSEYLTGYVTLNKDGSERYTPLWATTAAEEKAAFEHFVDTALAIRSANPGAHIYHFAPYEPVAMKRLMGNYATRETELDELLRGRAFVDLHAVVKRALIAGVERYSIKDLEPFFGYTRKQDLREASLARRMIEQAMEAGAAPDTWADLRGAVEAYNREDCESTRRLRDWLEDLRKEAVDKGQEIPRSELVDGEASEGLSDLDQELRALRDGLLQKVPDDRTDWSDQDRATVALAHMMEFHRREEKATYWEYYRLIDLPIEDYAAERRALMGLEFLEVVEAARSPVLRYRFQNQELDARRGDTTYLADETDFGTIAAVNYSERTVDIKQRIATADDQATEVILHKRVSQDALRKSLMRYGEAILSHGFSGNPTYQSATSLLLRNPPVLPQGSHALKQPDETTLEAACRITGALNGQVLALQGPPGTGKTYTGAHIICTLKQLGLKVGVTAVSHKVITNLLEGACEEAAKMGLELNVLHKTDREYDGCWGIETTSSYPKTLGGLADGSVDVVGATAFGWARDQFEGAVDVLIVDEAGQMALSNTLAAAPAGQSLVLLGDPQQLEQPLQSSHPEGSEVSALQHWLNGAETMPAELGLFLEETYRLHPSIASFTSEVYYEGKLSARPELAKQKVDHPGSSYAGLEGSGLRYLPTTHTGRQAKSPEEAAAIAELVNDLLGGASWTDQKDAKHQVTVDDILLVAPYNAQVAALSDALPELSHRIGTVDRFQGQEAPIVIYSMTSSSPEDAPRGMDFLYDGHRFNVATSRARALCVLVGTPALLEPECRTPRQMKMANGFCRYLELATVIEKGT